MNTSTDRRNSPRAAASFPMRVELGGKTGLAHVQDISASGVRCATSRPMPLMTQVGLVIQLPARDGRGDIVCRGAVVRSGPVAAPSAPGLTYETAIFFTDMEDGDRVRLSEFVASASRSAEL